MIDYISVGNGPENVIFLHGWKMDHTCFEGMHPALDKERRTYIFVDQRGYGRSRDLEGPYTIAQIAEDLVELADALKWSRFHIVGHSMGGKVLCRLMADVPQRIKSAVGITPCPPVKIPFDEAGWALFSNAAKHGPSRQEIFQMSTGGRLTRAWYEMITEKSMQASIPEAFADYLDSWVNYECHEAVMGCTVPVKILPGEHDPHLTYDLMVQTFGAWFPNATISQLANCGHYPMYETPLALAAECEQFIGQYSDA